MTVTAFTKDQAQTVIRNLDLAYYRYNRFGRKIDAKVSWEVLNMFKKFSGGFTITSSGKEPAK